jgi:hypothetical protein
MKDFTKVPEWEKEVDLALKKTETEFAKDNASGITVHKD